jgi:uncharacterized protein with PIN domain
MDDQEATGTGGDLNGALRFAADAMLGRLARCLLCNAPLDAMERQEALAVLPEGVRDVPGPVRRCPSCGRLYWDGSHVRRMRAALERVLPGWLEA